MARASCRTGADHRESSGACRTRPNPWHPSEIAGCSDGRIGRQESTSTCARRCQQNLQAEMTGFQWLATE
eukprot:1581165-Amphidinium_carterae.1